MSLHEGTIWPLEDKTHVADRITWNATLLEINQKANVVSNALFPLTCYMNMSMPGTVNVKVSKKHTVDGQKIFWNKHNDLLPQKLGASVVAGSP